MGPHTVRKILCIYIYLHLFQPSCVAIVLYYLLESGTIHKTLNFFYLMTFLIQKFSEYVPDWEATPGAAQWEPQRPCKRQNALVLSTKVSSYFICDNPRIMPLNAYKNPWRLLQYHHGRLPRNEALFSARCKSFNGNGHPVVPLTGSETKRFGKWKSVLSSQNQVGFVSLNKGTLCIFPNKI